MSQTLPKRFADWLDRRPLPWNPAQCDAPSNIVPGSARPARVRKPAERAVPVAHGVRRPSAVAVTRGGSLSRTRKP